MAVAKRGLARQSKDRAPAWPPRGKDVSGRSLGISGPRPDSIWGGRERMGHVEKGSRNGCWLQKAKDMCRRKICPQ